MHRSSPDSQVRVCGVTSSRNPKNIERKGRGGFVTSDSRPEVVPTATGFGSLSPLWLDVLPVDVSERVARFASRGRCNRTLLYLARTSPQQRLACIAALDYTLRPNSQRGPETSDEWGRLFVGHVRKLELCSKPWMFGSRLLSRLMLGPQLRHFVLSPGVDERITSLLSKRNWDNVQVDLVIGDEQPLREVRKAMRLVNPRRVIFENYFAEESTDFVDGKGRRASERKTLDALRSVPEVHLLGFQWTTRWVPRLSRLPGHTSAGVTTEIPLNLLPSLKKVDEVRIAGPLEGQVTSLTNFAVLGRTVVELDLLHLAREYVMPAHHLASLAEWFPNLRQLEIGLEAGSEAHLSGVLPKLSELTDLSLSWAWESEQTAGDTFYRPAPRAVFEGLIERCTQLSNVCLYEIELDAHELEQILRHVGGRLRIFQTTLNRGPDPLERALAVAIAAVQYCPGLIFLETKAEKTKAWREKSAVWRRKLEAAGELLEKRCLFLQRRSLVRFYR